MAGLLDHNLATIGRMSQAASHRTLRPWQLSLRELLVLTLAVSMVIGLSVRITQHYTIEFLCRHLPESDSDLEQWARTQPGVRSVQLERTDRITLRFDQEGTLGNLQPLGRPPLEEFGYDRVDSIHWTVVSSSLLTAWIARTYAFLRHTWWIVVPLAAASWFAGRIRQTHGSMAGPSEIRQA
jgi:hypothetical protein